MPARAENVAVIRHAIGGLGEALDIGDQTLSDVKLAVTEACTNAVVHAYPDGEGPLEVAAYVQDDRLMLVVRDEGRGIVPRTDSPGLGLGQPQHLAQAEHDVAGGGQMREQVEALEDHAGHRTLARQFAVAEPVAAAIRRAVADGLAVEDDVAALILFQQVDAAQQRRLARAAGADDRDDVAPVEIEVDALEHVDGAEPLGQAADRQEGLLLVHQCCPTRLSTALPSWSSTMLIAR